MTQPSSPATSGTAASASAPNPAQMYEQYFVPAMFRPWAEHLLRHAAPRRGEAVLDVACGTGVVARACAERVAPGGRVGAIDINPAMLAVAQGLASAMPVEWKQGSAQALPYADGSFDLVVCQHGLQFFPDRPQAVAEMRRTLRPRGRAAAIVLHELGEHPVFEAVFEALAAHLQAPLAAFAVPFALGSAVELQQLFERAGFSHVGVHAEAITARFPTADRFVPLAIMSSAAAVPAFAGLEAQERTDLVAAVGAQVAPVLAQWRQGDELAFPMRANVALAAA